MNDHIVEILQQCGHQTRLLSRMFPSTIVNNTSIKDVRAQNLLTYRAVFMKSSLRFVDLQEKLQRERLRYVLSAIHERYLMLILRHV